METITSTNGNDTYKTKPVHKTTNEKDLLSLLDQYTNLMSPKLDGLSTAIAVVINEASLGGNQYNITPHYSSTVHNKSTV